MEEKDRQLILKIANRLGAIEEELRFLKGAKPPIQAPVKPLNASRAANKFFGATTSQTEPECSVVADMKGGQLDAEEQAELSNGQKMLRKAVMEFCEEFDIKEFTIHYTDPTPKKE